MLHRIRLYLHHLSWLMKLISFMRLVLRIVGYYAPSLFVSLTPHIIILLKELGNQSFVVKICVNTSSRHLWSLRISFLVCLLTYHISLIFVSEIRMH